MNRNPCMWTTQLDPPSMSLNKDPLQLHHSTRARQDCCYQRLDEFTSQLPGQYQLSGFDSSCVNPADLAVFTYQQPKSQGNGNRCFPEDKLTFSWLTNQRQINQLYTRPYLGWYEGAGQPPTDPDIVDMETSLIQSDLTKFKSNCNRSKETSQYRFNCLPEYGNPQRVEHIIEPWVRGGIQTRDHIRRVHRKCLH